MTQPDKTRDVWPSKRWQDRVARFFGATPAPPPALSTLVQDVTDLEREVASLGRDALNLQGRWWFADCNLWEFSRLWFYLYQVQANRQPEARCRAVIELLMRYGADLHGPYGEAQRLGGWRSFAYLELERARKRNVERRQRDRTIQAVELIKIGGGELHPTSEGVGWSSVPGGSELELSQDMPGEIMICALLNAGLLEAIPGKSNPHFRSETAYRLTGIANATLASAETIARDLIDRARASATGT